MTFAIVPVGKDGQIKVSDKMKQDAQASVANIEGGGGPWLYLCNSDAKVVEENKAVKGDFVVMGKGDDLPVLGQSPMFIVLSQHKRHAYYIGKGDDRKLVWDAAREAMTTAQAEQADLDWADPHSAKPYDAYTLVHVGDKGVDPFKVGPISYKSSAHTGAESKKWLTEIKNYAAKGVPMFAQVWKLTGKLKDTGHGSKKYTIETAFAGQVNDGDELYGKLKESWQHAQAMLTRGKGTATEAAGSKASWDDVAAEMADAEAVGRVSDADMVVEDGDYATSLPPETKLPAIAAEALEVGYSYATELACGKDAVGKVLRRPVENMTFNEAVTAYNMAKPHITDPKHGAKARGAVVLLQDLAGANGWDADSFDLPPF